MVLTLLTRLLVWAAVGMFLWFVLLRFIRRPFLAWFGGVVILTVLVWSYVDPNDETIGAIWNLLSFPLTPLGFSLTLLMFSFKEFPFKEGFKVTNGRYVAAALSLLIICSVPVVARFLINQAELAVNEAFAAQRGICADVCPATIPETAPLGSVAAMVVVGENMDAVTPPAEASSRADSAFSLSPVLVSRLDSAGSLFGDIRRAGGDPQVFVTSGPVFGGGDEQDEKEDLLRQAVGNNFGNARVDINDNGTDVHRTMEEVLEYLVDNELVDSDRNDRVTASQQGSSRVALVAPGVTMRRAALTFEREGLQVVAWPTNLYGGVDIFDEDTIVVISDFVPSVEALRLTTYYWDEVLTSFYYFLRGWLPGFDVRWSEIVELAP